VIGLILIAVFFRDVVFGYFVRLYFGNIGIRRVLNSTDNSCLEILSLFSKLSHTFRIDVFNVRECLSVA